MWSRPSDQPQAWQPLSAMSIYALEEECLVNTKLSGFAMSATFSAIPKPLSFGFQALSSLKLLTRMDREAVVRKGSGKTLRTQDIFCENQGNDDFREPGWLPSRPLSPYPRTLATLFFMNLSLTQMEVPGDEFLFSWWMVRGKPIHRPSHRECFLGLLSGFQAPYTIG